MYKYIFANCSYGQRKKGVELAHKLITPHVKKYIKLSNDKFHSKNGYYLLRDIVYQTNKNNTIPITIGGDHSISLGSLSGSLKHHKDNLTTIWIDAHADINTEESSPSGNLHGMPLSYLTGLEKDFFKDEKTNLLNTDNLLYLGIRDIDKYEEEIINEKNIKYLTSNDINNNINKLNDVKIMTDNIHVSIDVDVLDPKYMKSTGTPVDNGISLDKLEQILKWIKSEGNVTSIDIVEFNPKIGNIYEYEYSLHNFIKLLNMIHILI